MRKLFAGIIYFSVVLFLSCAQNIAPVDISHLLVEMAKVEAAGKQFQMGSNEGSPNEKPVHTVIFTKDFLISKTEVTQQDYTAILGFCPSKFQGDSLPVEKITWFDAVFYCNARSKVCGFDTVYEYAEIIGTPGDSCILVNPAGHLDRNGFRLPTEAEWEYACRAGTKTKYYWGDSDDNETVGKYAWYSNNSENKTHNVGEKLPNDYGLYDMCGNVYEWCNDWYGEYGSNSVIDPAGPDSGIFRVQRGGCRFTPYSFCMVSRRGNNYPSYRSSSTGFRIVRPLTP